MIAFIFAEYHLGLKSLLRCEEMADADKNFIRYLQSLKNIKVLLNYLYFVFI